MKCLFLITLFLAQNILGAGASDLDKPGFLAARNDSNIFPVEVQLLYAESWNDGHNFRFKTMRIYGNGVIAFSDGDCSETDRRAFYYVDDKELPALLFDNIVDLGLFNFESEGVYLTDALGEVTISYYIYLCVDDQHYSITFSNVESEEPTWVSIVNYLRSLISEYMIEENEVDGEDYLNIMDMQHEMYGVHPLFTTYSDEKYVREES